MFDSDIEEFFWLFWKRSSHQRFSRSLRNEAFCCSHTPEMSFYCENFGQDVSNSHLAVVNGHGHMDRPIGSSRWTCSPAPAADICPDTDPTQILLKKINRFRSVDKRRTRAKVVASTTPGRSQARNLGHSYGVPGGSTIIAGSTIIFLVRRNPPPPFHHHNHN
jgi:hypothetical protein